jgi:putative ABC transport system permease protein
MWKILLEEFWGDLRTQKTRALLTMFAVTWGTVSVVLLLSFGEGLKRSVVKGTLGMGGEVLFLYGGETSVPHQGLPRGRAVRLQEEDLGLLLRTVPELETGSVSYGRWGAQLKTDALTTTTMMEGVDPAFEELRHTYAAAGGRFLNERDAAERRRVVFLGDSIAGRLFPGGEAVGRTLLLDGVPLTVVGTMQGKMQMSMNNGPDAERALIPGSTFRALYGHRYVSHLIVRPENAGQMARAAERVREVLGRKYAFAPEDERAVSVWDHGEELKTTRLITGGIQAFLGVVGALTLLVAGVGVANVMYVVVRERTREIGIKRAMGARRRHIMAQFVFEALVIALSGGLAGLAFASVVVVGVDAIPDGGNEALQFLANPRLSWPIAFLTVGILAAIGLLAGLFPARRAAGLDPVESLRYE